MKKYLLAVLFAGLGLTALADDGTNDECQINGTESMDAVVILTATSNAPAGAAGVAKIESENDDGNEAAQLNVKTFGLDPGIYDLSITLQSTGSNVDLGQFAVTPGSEDDGEDSGINVAAGAWVSCDFGGYTNWGCWTNWSNSNFVSGGVWAKWFAGQGSGTNSCPGTNGSTVTETETALPPGVNPTDIAEIIVSDMNSNAVLIGDLVTPAAGTVVNVSGTVQVVAGPGAPGLSGTAQVQSTASKGKWKHQFTLAASGAAAKSTFKLEVNGQHSGAARSNKSGQMTIKKLPSHVPALRSLKLLDAQGNVAGSAQF